MTRFKPSECILYCDLDGTYLADSNEFRQAEDLNYHAVQLFIQSGGIFSIASGRTYPDITRLFPSGFLASHVVCAGGGAIVDPLNERVINMSAIDSGVKKACLDFCDRNPEFSLTAMDVLYYYRVKTGDGRHGLSSRSKAFVSGRELLENDYVKLALKAPTNEKMLQCIETLQQSVTEINMSPSSEICLDIVQSGVSKASAIDFIRRYTSHGRKILCIGDYFNDIDMLRYADISACPSDSSENVKKASSIVTCRNNSGAVKDFIEQVIDFS